MHHHQPHSSNNQSFLLRVDDIEHVLRERLALLPGARDRENRPIIFVPARDISSNLDHIRNLMHYLYYVTDGNAKIRGFIFVIDMHKKTSWEIVKPILKSLQEYFPAHIHCVYIIKPEKFFDKYKISTSKYHKFEIQMISIDSLPKHIDFCQILREFGGSLRYDHDEWIEFRRDIERIEHRMSEIKNNLDKIINEMKNAEMPIDAVAAQASILKHQNLHPIIMAVPIDEFEREIHLIREKLIASGSQQQNGFKGNQMNGSVPTSFINPDFTAVLPRLTHLLKELLEKRDDILQQWKSRFTELDQYSQFKLFEQDTENLSRWVYTEFNNLTHKFVLVGENELETGRILKEHIDFADSVNKIEVSYTALLNVGARLLEVQTQWINKIENILQQLKSDWSQFINRIEQRSMLLNITLNSHKKCAMFMRNAEHWKKDVGINPHALKSSDELQKAAKEHADFKEQYENLYFDASEEVNELFRMLKKFFGESATQLPIYNIVQEQIQNIANKRKSINSIWEARDETLRNKLSSVALLSDLNSVLEWLTEHGEAFLHRKIAIGIDQGSTYGLMENHQKFKNVANNTHKNADKIFALVHVLEDADAPTRSEAFEKIRELRLRIDDFKRCIEYRTQLLKSAYYFYLHYDEIMEWYGKMEERAASVYIVPDSVEQCERNKETFLQENSMTEQAYERVMVEAHELLIALKLQQDNLKVDNNEAVAYVQNLKHHIENKHSIEKERWQEQRIYLNASLKISTFLRDCYEIKKQLENWRQDLQGLRHSVSTTVEIIKQYHTQNTIKVQQVVEDAMKQLSEILQFVESKSLRMLSAIDSKPIEDMVILAAEQLKDLEDEVMNIAKDISNRIELTIHLSRLNQFAQDIICTIQQEHMHLLEMYKIPKNQQETDSECKDYNEFRNKIEIFGERISEFYNEKERFTALPLLALDSHAETRVSAETLLANVKMKWQHLVGLIDNRNKLLTAANSYYKYTKLLKPTSESIIKDLSIDRDVDFCQTADWNNLEHCYDIIQERLDKHYIHKERFLEASAYAQRTADQFMRFMKRCEAPRDHYEKRLKEVQDCKSMISESQKTIFKLWTECNARIEKCRDAIRIKLLAKEIIDWSDRELATCARIKDNAEKMKKFESAKQLAELQDLLERCMKLKDLIKVERYGVRKMLNETKRFVELNSGDIHALEIEKISLIAKDKLENIWKMLSYCEQTIKDALNLDMPITTNKTLEQHEQFYSNRDSDNTIEEKLTDKESAADNVLIRKIMEPMKELLKSERDYVDDLRRCVDIYFEYYRTSGSSCPKIIRGKEREIFGNIKDLYQFHYSTFYGELVAYEHNPEDVGYCFITWMEKLKDLYADYCLNNGENNHLICLPEAISFFNTACERNNLEPSNNLQSLLIKPIQRITKYDLLLTELLKYSTKNTKEIENVHEIVSSIPKLANDRMHLKTFEDYQKYNVGDFVMQDTFLVSAKRYFRREKELQVFLFESNIVFAKREELPSKKTGYVYKDSMLIREIHVVEHIEADNTKFGLRRSAFPYQNDQNTTVLKASNESQRIHWVKVLRDLKMEIGRQKISTESCPLSNDNRASRDSQSSLISQSVQSMEDCEPSIHSADSSNYSNGHVVLREQHNYAEYKLYPPSTSLEKQLCQVTEPFIANKADQLSVQTGQRVELVEPQQQQLNDMECEFIKVILLDCTHQKQQKSRSGFVPRRILIPLQTEADVPSTSSAPQDVTASTSGNKRTSFRRFFTSNQKTDSNKNLHGNSRPTSSSSTIVPDQPSTSSLNYRTTDELTAATGSVLSPPHCPSRSSNTAATAISSHSTAVPASTVNDPDLPPPMDQLGENTSSANNNGKSSGNEQQQQQSFEMTDQKDNNSNAIIGGDSKDSNSTSSAAPPTASTPVEQLNAEESAKLKRSYVLQELVETERAYVLDLASIVDGYIGTLREMELSDEDREKVKIIFANIEQILDFHKNFFCKEIEKSLKDYEAAGNAFIKYERRLHTFYVKYCQNKPKSDFLVSQDNFEQLFVDIKDKLGHKVALTDLLIKPVQRITKYQLMLNDILKYTHRAKDRADVLERAHDVMRVVPKACDDMMQVGRLQGFQGNLNAQGRLIFQGTLLISDGGTNQLFKGKERRVFLFEQSVIIAECIPPRKEYGNPTYNFKNQIMVNKMTLDVNVAEDPLRFVLQSNDPNQPATYVAQAASTEDKEQWLGKLSAQLDQQKNLLAALVDPKRYQNQLANSVGSLTIGAKKDSSGSLGTPTSPVTTSSIAGGGGISPTRYTPTQKSSASKLFGFGGKQKS